jgi:hypothetical protein
MSEVFNSFENEDLNDVHFINFLSKMRSQMNFVGIMNIIFGALSCLTIIGAVVGVPQILSGIKLRESCENMDIFMKDGNTSQLKVSLKLMGKFYEYTKIYYIVNIVIFGLVILFYIIFFAFFGSMLLNEIGANV